jgi:hypothetical protein
MFAMILGLAMLPGFSYLDPPRKIADLLGVRDRRYLDLTARPEQRLILTLPVMAACARLLTTSLRAATRSDRISESYIAQHSNRHPIGRINRFSYSVAICTFVSPDLFSTCGSDSR